MPLGKGTLQARERGRATLSKTRGEKTKSWRRTFNNILTGALLRVTTQLVAGAKSAAASAARALVAFSGATVGGPTPAFA